jgi:hypothetical protein
MARSDVAQALTPADEDRLLRLSKRAVDLVDNQKLSPDEALVKLARDNRLGHGEIETLAHCYNNSRQLGQWRANTTAAEKTASFPLADPAKVIGEIYPAKVETLKEASDRTAFSSDYAFAPYWLPDEKAIEVSRRSLAPMVKAAGAGCSGGDMKPEPAKGNRIRKGMALAQQAKQAFEEARRHAGNLEDSLRSKIAELVTYFKYASDGLGGRLPFAQVEHAVDAYYGDEAKPLLKMAYERARLKEPMADKTPIQKLAFDRRSAPFTTIDECLRLGRDLNQARAWVKDAADLAQSVEDQYLRPFGAAPRVEATKVAAQVEATVAPVKGRSLVTREKRAIFGEAIGSALGNSMGRGVGEFPKTKGDLIEDDWLKLEDPSHENELRKIRTHAMLSTMLTDPDDPISGHDPAHVLKIYNEIAQTAPRVAESAEVLKPLLRRRLAGKTEPFESKELIDTEKGLKDTKTLTPNTMQMAEAPASVLG